MKNILMKHKTSSQEWYRVFKKTYLKKMCDFFNPKKVTIGSATSKYFCVVLEAQFTGLSKLIQWRVIDDKTKLKL